MRSIPAIRPTPLLSSALWAPFLVLALLSAAQIWFRQSLAGSAPSWGRIVWTNLLAWAPWPLLALGIGTLWIRWPFRRQQLTPAILLHSAAATLTALSYLLFLTIFRFAFFSGYTGPLSTASFGHVFATEVGDFFAVTWVLYWGIGATALFLHGRRPSRVTLPDSRLEIRTAGRTRWVDLASVECIEADRSYAVIHSDGGTHLAREALCRLAERLGERGFARAHRSWIVNLTQVRELRSTSHGDAAVELHSGRRLPVSRTYRAAFERALEQGP